MYQGQVDGCLAILEAWENMRQPVILGSSRIRSQQRTMRLREYTN